MEENNTSTGLAFSGGGIRSAALCSGVLRRLLQRGVHVDYVSCVSGGNYTAAAYLDWKYRHGKEDDDGWHKEFFEHMRKRVGYICDWQAGWQGLLDTIILVALLITINLVIPCVMYSAGAFTSAVIIDFLFGKILRQGFECEGRNATTSARGSRCIVSCVQFDITDPKLRDQSILFASLFILFAVCHVVKVSYTSIIRSFARFLEIVSGLLFAFTFIPWLIHQFSDVLPTWLKISVFILSTFFWLGFPPLRKQASSAIVLYFYAFVITWRVYQCRTFFLPEYREELFDGLLLISSFLIWISPFLGIFSDTATFTYYKWRLQKAFFTEESVGSHGCRGISCKDFFPILSCFACCRSNGDPEHDPKHDPEHDRNTHPLKMSDLRDIKPQYVSNVAVDYWRLNSSSRSTPPFAVVSLAPDTNQRIDGPPEHTLNIDPENVDQVDAMVTSAAVMALSPEQNEPFRDLQIMLGLSLRKGFKTGQPQEQTPLHRRLCYWLLTYLIHCIVAFPVMFIAVIAFANWDTEIAEFYAVGVFVVYSIGFLGIAVMPTGRDPAPCYDRFVRWCHVHLYQVRFLREVLKVNNVGPNPPAILSLSDGGRLEMYGLLYLLKRRLKKILIVDGSLIAQEANYSKSILKSMDQARELLHCEFVGFHGGDVKEQMRKGYVEDPKGRGKPRHFQFSVQYFKEEEDGSYSEDGTGDILIIAPRHPDKGVKPPQGKDTTWNHYELKNLDTKVWGEGPFLSAQDVDGLTFCCCECCHKDFWCVSQISKMLCLGFPSTSTINQFFTSSLFTAYHREGYRACVESNADVFLDVHA